MTMIQQITTITTLKTMIITTSMTITIRIRPIVFNMKPTMMEVVMIIVQELMVVTVVEVTTTI